jgi:hypothetical protein
MEIVPVSKIYPPQANTKKHANEKSPKQNKPKDTSFEGILSSILNSEENE